MDTSHYNSRTVVDFNILLVRPCCRWLVAVVLVAKTASKFTGRTLGKLITMWNCPKCKTAISSDFDSCWNCGTEASGRIDQEFVHADQYRPRQTTKPSQFSILWLMIITASICYGIALSNYVFVIAGLTFLVLSFACNALGK